MKRIIALLLALLLLAGLAGCVNDPPPKEDTPEPAPLDGSFVSGDSSLRFNGDGKSVVLELDAALAARSGLPAGTHEGSYVFLLYNGSYRYDKAEYFRIILDGTDYQFRNSIGTTDGDTVAFALADGSESFTFQKQPGRDA